MVTCVVYLTVFISKRRPLVLELVFHSRKYSAICQHSDLDPKSSYEAVSIDLLPALRIAARPFMMWVVSDSKGDIVKVWSLLWRLHQRNKLEMESHRQNVSTLSILKILQN
jgi:hypothetical protein